MFPLINKNQTIGNPGQLPVVKEGLSRKQNMKSRSTHRSN